MMNLREILIDTFNNSSIPEDITDLKMGDLDEWDSLGNFNLIMAVEQMYQIQFDIDCIEKMTSVSEIKKEIDNALSKQ
jgi:acyl carrier protein